MGLLHYYRMGRFLRAPKSWFLAWLKGCAVYLNLCLLPHLLQHQSWCVWLVFSEFHLPPCSCRAASQREHVFPHHNCRLTFVLILKLGRTFTSSHKLGFSGCIGQMLPSRRKADQGNGLFLQTHTPHLNWNKNLKAVLWHPLLAFSWLIHLVF